MKSTSLRILTLLLALLCVHSDAFAQYRCTVHVSTHPPSNLSDWTGRKDITIITVTNSGTKASDVKFDTRVYKNGSLIAQTKPESMRTITAPVGVSQWFGEDVIPFDAVKFIGNVDRTAAKTGTLPAGDYQLCVSLLDATTLKQLTQPVCGNFSLTSYQAPQLIEPANKSTLSPTNRPMFRWTAVSPLPPSTVNYHLQVFEVLQGQSTNTAYKVNHPILDQTLQTTQLLWPPDYELPQPGMQYVWAVQATDDQGNYLGEPKGIGGPFWFTAYGKKNQLNSDSLNGHPGNQDNSGNNGVPGNGNNGNNSNGNNSIGNNGSNSGGNNSNGSNLNGEQPITGNQPFTQGSALTGSNSQNGLTAITPKANAHFTTKDKKPTFSWAWSKEPPGVSYYILEAQQSESKKQISQRVKTKETAWPDLPFEEGTYFWKATAYDRGGTELGNTGGQTFSVMSNNYQIQYSVDSILCTDSMGKYRFVVTLCNTGVLPITFTPSDLTALDDITGLPDPNIILNVTTPSSMVTLNAPNCITISGTIKRLSTKMTGILQIRTNRVGGNILASMETENDTLPSCMCNKCDSVKIDTTKGKAHINPKTGHLEIQQPLSFGPDKLTGLTADIIYVGWQPENPKCMPCDKDPKQWGVLTSATYDGVGQGTITPNESHWALDGTHNVGNATFDINLPQLLECCKLHGAVCIRYKFYAQSDPAGECYECERVICYSF